MQARLQKPADLTGKPRRMHARQQSPADFMSKPRCTHARLQVRAYKELRSEDAAPGSGSSYRITVRQLEALVRPSLCGSVCPS